MSGQPSQSPPTPGVAPRLVVRVRRVVPSPVVSMRAWLRGGARAETIPGQTLVTGRMLGEGTARRDWRRISAEAEARGMALAAFGGAELHGAAIDALAGDWEQALDWLAELILESSFPEDRCAFLRRQAEAELESLADQADVETGWGFLEQLYAPHPLGRPMQGDRESLRRMTAADAAALHAAGLERGVILSIAGAIDEEAVRARTEKRFGGLSGSAVPAPAPAAPAGTSPLRREIQTHAADQVHLYIGHLTAPRVHPDFAALDILSVVLGAGSGLSGRIPSRVREREGLAYSAGAAAAAGAGLDAGRLVAYVATAPATAAQAERAVREEIVRLVEDGVEESELDDARNYLLGREPFRRETARQWADLMAEAELFGLPVDRREWVEESYRDLDVPTVNAVARRHFHPEKLKVTVGLPGRGK